MAERMSGHRSEGADETSPGGAPASEGPGRAGGPTPKGSEKLAGFDPADKAQPAEGGVEEAEDGAAVGDGREG